MLQEVSHGGANGSPEKLSWRFSQVALSPYIREKWNAKGAAHIYGTDRARLRYASITSGHTSAAASLSSSSILLSSVKRSVVSVIWFWCK